MTLRVDLLRGASREYIRSLPTDPVDVIITDPPYGEATHKGAMTTRSTRTRASEVTSLVHFPPITTEDFLDITAQFVRICKRWVVMTCEWRHAAHLEESGLPLVRLGVWVKPDSAPQFTGDRPGVGWEAVAILHREGKKRWNGGGHHAVWRYPVERGNDHPTQKPLAMIRKWVRDFSDPSETIMDPYMGGGTTGVAAFMEKRHFIGIEIDQNYFNLSRNRLDRVQGTKKADDHTVDGVAITRRRIMGGF